MDYSAHEEDVFFPFELIDLDNAVKYPRQKNLIWKEKMSFLIRPITPEDRVLIIRLLTDHWGTPLVVSRGKIHDASQLPGFVAFLDNDTVGLTTYRLESQECELVTLNSWRENLGIGTALIEAVRQEALKANCCRLWLITTNDNLHALGFYQKREFHLVAVHPDALSESRKIKPSIPTIGLQGIPLRDELELELRLSRQRLC